MPIFGRIGISFSPWQSQLGDTSTIREIWKFGRPSITALVYSAMRQLRRHWRVVIKGNGVKLQAPRQRPQPTQPSRLTSILRVSSLKIRPLLAHSFWHLRQPLQSSGVIWGFPLLCCSVFPALEPQPIPIFFDSASKSCGFVAFKMGQADKYVSIHHCPSDLCSFYIFAAFYRHIYIIGSLKAVSDNDGTSHGQRSKAVFPMRTPYAPGHFFCYPDTWYYSL